MILIYVIEVLLTIIELLGVVLETPALEIVVQVTSLVFMIPLGIMAVVFAIILLRLPDTLHGLLKPFAYTTIASGFCDGTLILLPVGLLIGSVRGILLGMIFLFVRAADGAREVASS
jgi:hypothetical protein